MLWREPTTITTILRPTARMPPLPSINLILRIDTRNRSLLFLALTALHEHEEGAEAELREGEQGGAGAKQR